MYVGDKSIIRERNGKHTPEDPVRQGEGMPQAPKNVQCKKNTEKIMKKSAKKAKNSKKMQAVYKLLMDLPGFVQLSAGED